MTTARYILRRFSRVVAYIGLGAWFIGTCIAWYLGAAEMVQRFGALGVAASVLFFSDRLTQIELGRQRSVERLLHEYGVELAAMRQGTAPKDLPPEGFAVDFLTEERNFGGLRQRAELFNVLNVLLMTLATLQWGFGDRIVTRLGCGISPC